MSAWSVCESRLVELLAGAERGPRREGLFALWLTVRVAEGALSEPPLPEKAQRKRTLALRKRLSFLTLPGPLRRAITAAYPKLEQADAETVRLALQDLVAPVRDVLGTRPAEAITDAVNDERLTSEP